MEKQTEQAEIEDRAHISRNPLGASESCGQEEDYSEGDRNEHKIAEYAPQPSGSADARVEIRGRCMDYRLHIGGSSGKLMGKRTGKELVFG